MSWSLMAAGSNISMMPVFRILCFKGHCTTSLISRHFLVALIVSTFLTTLSDNSLALQPENTRGVCIRRLFTAIKITRTSL